MAPHGVVHGIGLGALTAVLDESAEMMAGPKGRRQLAQRPANHCGTTRSELGLADAWVALQRPRVLAKDPESGRRQGAGAAGVGTLQSVRSVAGASDERDPAGRFDARLRREPGAAREGFGVAGCQQDERMLARIGRMPTQKQGRATS